MPGRRKVGCSLTKKKQDLEEKKASSSPAKEEPVSGSDANEDVDFLDVKEEVCSDPVEEEHAELGPPKDKPKRKRQPHAYAFSDDQDLAFAAFLMEPASTFLYDRRSADYKIRSKKDARLKEFASTLTPPCSSEQLRLHYESLRSQYTRATKPNLLPSGSSRGRGPTDRVKFIMDTFSFFKNHIHRHGENDRQLNLFSSTSEGSETTAVDSASDVDMEKVGSEKPTSVSKRQRVMGKATATATSSIAVHGDEYPLLSLEIAPIVQEVSSAVQAVQTPVVERRTRTRELKTLANHLVSMMAPIAPHRFDAMQLEVMQVITRYRAELHQQPSVTYRPLPPLQHQIYTQENLQTQAQQYLPQNHTRETSHQPHAPQNQDYHQNQANGYESNNDITYTDDSDCDMSE